MTMRCNALILFSLSLYLVTFAGCGGAQDPAGVLDAANKAFFTDRDYDGAIEGYRKLLDWKGDGKATSDQRFEASLNMVRCKVRKQDFDGAMDSLKEMQKIHQANMTYKNYCTVISEMLQEKATSKAIDVLTVASELYPDKKDEFQKQAELIKARGVSNEELERLKTLGYL